MFNTPPQIPNTTEHPAEEGHPRPIESSETPRKPSPSTESLPIEFILPGNDTDRQSLSLLNLPINRAFNVNIVNTSQGHFSGACFVQTFGIHSSMTKKAIYHIKGVQEESQQTEPVETKDESIQTEDTNFRARKEELLQQAISSNNSGHPPPRSPTRKPVFGLRSCPPMKSQSVTPEDDSGNADLDRSENPALKSETQPGLSQPTWESSVDSNAPIATGNTFDQLCSMTTRLFKEVVIREIDHSHLCIFQKQLLYYIAKRGFTPRYTAGFESPDVTTCFVHLHQLANVEHIRRPEECYKYVLQRVFRHLHRQMESEGVAGDRDAVLRERYFGDLARKMDAPLTDFALNVSGQGVGTSLYCSTFIGRALKSEAFARELEAYTAGPIFEDFHKEVTCRISSLFKRLERTLTDSPAAREQVNQVILKYVIFSKHCKLPWTLTDVRQAVDKVVVLLKEKRAEAAATSSS